MKMDWNKNGYKPDWNNNYTWEVKVKDYFKNYDDWTNIATTNTAQTKPIKETPPPPTDEAMVEDILSRAEDKGFFEDMVDWLRSDAPRKLRRMLKELYPPMHTGPVACDRLCEALYQTGFRTTERLERRMMLGPSNEWVREYFEDFPPKP